MISYAQREYAETWFTRLRGLLWTDSNVWMSKQLVLRPCQSIHTIGMRYPLDIAFIDRRHRVVASYTDIPPNRVVVGPGEAQIAIERPTQDTDWYQVGERLHLKARSERNHT
ncbi:MAG: DUF192 domain-containing protein [Coriobacteriia bacterium]|nr:DUF192 domain-containing protein [Coriobacteriia bacterium]